MDYMDEALKEAYEGIGKGHGGPFGTVIVKDGTIVGRGHNRVVYKKDPTCHGEMEAIRDACRTLDTFDLAGCDLYTTAEPCPMCLGAALWANIRTIYYGCSREDVDEIGFRDKKFYEYLDGEAGVLKVTEMGRRKCRRLFKEYVRNDGKTMY